MKDKLSQAARAAGHVLEALWGLFSKNLGLKLLSVLFALFLWSYVITSSPTITREKTLSGIDVTVTGQSVLTSRDLAALRLDEQKAAQVRVRVSQSSFSQVTSDNVRVELDLSQVRSAGKQQVRLRGVTTYGSVIQVSPAYMDVEIEQRDERDVPVNVALTGNVDLTNYWYSPGRRNPAQVKVSGPTSLVQQVSSAQVEADVTGRFETYSADQQYRLIDAQGNEVNGALTRSTTSVTVPITIYPQKLVDVTNEIQELTNGNPAPGYEVTHVEVSPKQVTVAAEQTLLDGLTVLTIEPVDITGASQTFPAVAKVIQLKGVQNLSSEEVQVTVTIEEMKQTTRFKDIEIDFINQSEGRRVTPSIQSVDAVRITGPASVVGQLKREDVQATVDLMGLELGQYELPIVFAVDNHPGLSFAAKTATVTVTVNEN